MIATLKQTVYVPTVSTIFLTFCKEWFSPTFGQQAVPSLYRMIVGYFFATIIGVTIGIVIGSFKKIYQLLDPVLQFWRAIPATAIIPVGILLIGIGDQMKMVVICFGAMWPILINSADGARLVPTERLDTARIFGLTPFEDAPAGHRAVGLADDRGRDADRPVDRLHHDRRVGNDSSTDGLGYYILQRSARSRSPRCTAESDCWPFWATY